MLRDARAVYIVPKLIKGGFIFGAEGMMFNGRDGVEFVQTVKWFLHKGERPLYGRWTYWEKFDYFAVFWGMFIIGSTGTLLWFPEFFTLILPGWSVNVATILHSDEALLAVAFNGMTLVEYPRLAKAGNVMLCPALPTTTVCEAAAEL